MDGKKTCQDTAGHSAKNEKQNNAEVLQPLFFHPRILGAKVSVKTFGGTSEIPCAHGSGKLVATDFTKALHLDRTDKGNDRICQG